MPEDTLDKFKDEPATDKRTMRHDKDRKENFNVIITEILDSKVAKICV